MTHGIIFTGWKHSILISPQAGGYRMRTYLEQHGYRIEVIDHLDRWTLPEIMEVIELACSDDLKFIGFSLSFFSNLRPHILRWIKLRWPHLKLILGGQEVVLKKIPDVQLVDKALLGYSEEAMLHYLDFLTGKRQDDLDWIEDEETGVHYIIADKQYPYTNTDDLRIDWKSSDEITSFTTLPLETSRGCIFRCLFCSYPLLGKKKMDYLRGVDNMADEFKRNYDMFGVTNYAFMDDTLNESVAKLEHINKAIKKSGVPVTFSCYMRIDLVSAFPEMTDLLLDMGLVGGFIGVESMNETARKTIGKGLSNEKLLQAISGFRDKTDRIWFEAGLIIGLPGETVDSIIETNEWMRSNTYFDHWYWNPLYIARYHCWLTSAFDRDHAKYGYRFVSDDLMDPEWKTDLMTFSQATELADQLNTQNMDVNGLSAWLIGHLHSYGISFEAMRTMRWKDLNYTALMAEKTERTSRYKSQIRDRLNVTGRV